MNYSLVINSQFKPYELSDLMPLYQANTQAQSAAEEQAITLQTQADMYKNEALKNPNSRAAQIYNNYANDLQKQADDLLNNGLNANNRKGLLAMRGRYIGEIGNIAKAVAAMQENNKLVTSANMNDPTSMYWRYNNDLDSYLDGNKPEIHRVSGKTAEQDAMQMAAAMSSREWNTAKSRFDSYNYIYRTQNGFTNKQVADILNNDKELNNLFNPIRDAYGYNNLSTEDKKRFDNYLMTGAMKGFTYKQSDQMVADNEALANLELQKERQKAAIDYPNLPTDPNDNINLKPENILSAEERDERYVNRNKHDYLFIGLDKGNSRLTKQGQEDYRFINRLAKDKKFSKLVNNYLNKGDESAFNTIYNELKDNTYLSKSKLGVKAHYSEIGFNTSHDNKRALKQLFDNYKFINSLHVKGSGGVGAVGNAYVQYKRKLEEGPVYDAYKQTEYSYPIDVSSKKQQDNLKASIQHWAGEGKLRVIDLDSKTKKFKLEDNWNIEDLLDEDTRIYSIQTSATTMNNGSVPVISIKVQKGGKEYRIEIPGGDKAVDAIRELTQQAEFAREKALKYKTIMDNTQDEKKALEAAAIYSQSDNIYKIYQRKINEGIASMMMVNETDSQKHDATGTLK